MMVRSDGGPLGVALVTTVTAAVPSGSPVSGVPGVIPRPDHIVIGHCHPLVACTAL